MNGYNLLFKFLRIHVTLFNLLCDYFFVPLWLRLNAVHFKTGCHFTGFPILEMVPGGRINIGERVSIISRADSNPCGLPHPTILATLSSESNIEIGDGSGISGASIVSYSKISIGRNVLIGAGSCIWDTDFHASAASSKREAQPVGIRSLPIIIEDNVFIGARVIILKGVHIGEGAVVGAGSVVRDDVGAGDIVIGNPSQVISSIKEK